MKLAFLLLTLLTSMTYAYPLLRADLVELDEHGTAIYPDLKRELTLNGLEGSSGVPSSFTYCEESESHQISCVLFWVSPPPRAERCGGVQYRAYEDPHFSPLPEADRRWLEVVEWASNIPNYCAERLDSSKKLWQVRLMNSHSRRFFTGNPQ